MAKQTIDTLKVETSVRNLRTANKNINNAYEPLKNNIKQLEKHWKGKAGTAAHTAVADLNKISGARSGVIDNYIITLEKIVVPGYNASETANKKLADNFK
jgi:uncharacterized protein YukE